MAAARQAFDEGPWPRLTHAERAEYLRAFAEGLRSKHEERRSAGSASPAALSSSAEGFIAKGVADGATLATGGGRPKHLDRGWFIEPTVFGNVDNSSTLAQEEISDRS